MKNPILSGILDENALLARIRKQAGGGRLPSFGPSLALGIGDDAALFRSKSGFQIILTCDWFLEGTHFLRTKHPPESVGWKCLARALSDIAAMGGSPRCFLLSLALPQPYTGGWLDRFFNGLCRAAKRFGCRLAGGDTTRRDEILINVTVIGEVRRGQALLRSGAQPGDIIYVSGRLGEADLGLHLLRHSKHAVKSGDPWLRKHLYPKPRFALGSWLAEKRIASAMMDISDGLSSDLPRLCAASGVGARVEQLRIPCVRHGKAALSLGLDPLELALHGGDDYELLFTVPPKRAKSLPTSFRGVPLTAIGSITAKKQILLADQKGRERPLPARGRDPFRTARLGHSG